MKAQAIQLRERTVDPPLQSAGGGEGDRRPKPAVARQVRQTEFYCAIWFLNTTVCQVLAVASRAACGVRSPMIMLWKFLVNES